MLIKYVYPIVLHTCSGVKLITYKEPLLINYFKTLLIYLVFYFHSN